MHRELTVRALIVGAIGSIVVGLSSTYIALKMGALPWPTVFVALTSFAILKLMGDASINEVNVAHTAMSAGGLVAGGLAFTIPGVWMSNLGEKISPCHVMWITISGAIFGVLFTGMIRRYLIEEARLRFPLGIAAAETLISSFRGGSKGKSLLWSFVFAAIFAAIRDWSGKIPSVISWKSLQKRNFFVGIALYPMALGIGYIIGPLYTLAWFGGSILSYVLIIPILTGVMGQPVNWALDFVKMLGIGMIIGGGIAVLLVAFGRGKARKVRIDWPWQCKFALILTIIGLIIVPITGVIPITVSLVLIVLALVIAFVAGSVDGMTGIVPMEVLAILVVLALKLIWHPQTMTVFFLVAAFVAIVAGLAGDALQDMKAGYVLGTRPENQLIAEFIGSIVGGVAAVIGIFILHKVYGQMGPGTGFPAPQAFAVKSMIIGLKNPIAFWAGLGIGFLLQLFSIPAIVIGVGVYLPMVLSIPVAIGGLTRWFVEKKKWDVGTGTAIAAGFLGGEGLSGIAIGFLKLFIG